MTSPALLPSIAPVARAAPAASTSLGSQGRAVLRTVARRFTYPAESPMLSITLYYLVLGGVATLLLHLVPAIGSAFAGERLAEMAGQGGLQAPGGTAALGTPFSIEFALLLAVAMIGAFLLMVPASWVYMATRRKKGFDQSVVQTMLLLALSVAGVIVIVRNSVALAFSLAGIVGAVRYRNNLPETRDTLFIFLAIGVGLAAGVGSLPAAAALSMVFCYMVLLMMRVDYGMCELGKSSTHLLQQPGAAGPPDGAGRERRGRKPKGDFNAVLVVRTREGTPAQAAVERFLSQATKRWTLAQIETEGPNGRTHLKYLMRLGKKQAHADLEDALLEAGQPHILGARIH